MVKEKPLPERMDLVRERTRVSMVDCTEERERSVTSRQEEEREGDMSARVIGFLEAVELGFRTDSARSVRDWRIMASGFRRFWNGRVFEVVGLTVEGSPSSAEESER